MWWLVDLSVFPVLTPAELHNFKRNPAGDDQVFVKLRQNCIYFKILYLLCVCSDQ